jgi:hypothetical protein
VKSIAAKREGEPQIMFRKSSKKTQNPAVSDELLNEKDLSLVAGGKDKDKPKKNDELPDDPLVGPTPDDIYTPQP